MASEISRALSGGDLLAPVSVFKTDHLTPTKQRMVLTSADPAAQEYARILVNPLDSLERQNEKLLVISSALMHRIEQGAHSSGLAYAQFQCATGPRKCRNASGAFQSGKCRLKRFKWALGYLIPMTVW